MSFLSTLNIPLSPPTLAQPSLVPPVHFSNSNSTNKQNTQWNKQNFNTVCTLSRSENQEVNAFWCLMLQESVFTCGMFDH